MKNPQKSFSVLATVIVVTVLVVAAGWWMKQSDSHSTPTPSQVICQQDAKICPDGSSVARIGPNCQFAACPTSIPNPTANWPTYNWNTQLNVSVNFKYPSNWKVGKYSLGSNESIIVYPPDQSVNLQPANYSAGLDNLKHSIIFDIKSGGCLNTQCLTKINTADDWISELGATKLSGKLNVSGFEGYYVKVPGDNTYRYIFSKNGIIVEMNTISYVSYMTQIFNNLSISTN